MSFSIQPKTLKKIIDFYQPRNNHEEMKYMIYLKGQDQMYMNLQTSPFQGISNNSIEQRLTWFGSNKIINLYNYTFFDMLIKVFTQYTCLPWNIFFYLIIFVLGLFSEYNNLPIPYLQGLIGLVLLFLNVIIIFIVEYGKYSDLKNIYSFKGQKVISQVWRQNDKQQIDSQSIVVGDIVQLQSGDIVPADGWIIQGQLKVQQTYSYGIVKTSKANLKSCIHYLTKKSRNKTKRYSLNSKTKIDNKIQINQPSPAILGGSIVTEGQGKMVVLCVGKFSRQGQFQVLLKNKNPYKNMSILQNKLQQFVYQLFKYGLLGVILLILGLTIKHFVLNIIITRKFFGQGFNIKDFQYLTLAFNIFFMIIPQGISIGLGISLLIYKKRILWQHNILIKNSVNCQSMSYVQYICYQKQKQRSYFKIKQWWNYQKIEIQQNDKKKKLKKQDYQQTNSQKQQQKQSLSQEQQQLFSKVQSINPIYLQFFRKAMIITANSDNKQNKNLKNLQRSQNQLKYGSFRNLDQCFIDYSKRKSYINTQTIQQEQIIQQIPYDNITKRTIIVTKCPENIDIQYPGSPKITSVLDTTLKVPQEKINKKHRISLRVSQENNITDLLRRRKQQRKYIIYMRGKHETVLQHCNYIMSKQTGKVQEISQQKALEIKNIIGSMLRRQLRAIVLAIKITKKRQNFIQDISWNEQGGYVLIAILGINDMRSTQEFQLVSKIKELGINLMIASTNSMEDSISAANQIGIIKADDSSIIINGNQFLHVVGGIICDKCKKVICICVQMNGYPKVKNIDQFQRILKHLDVLANAEAFHKYTLSIGLQNKNICSAFIGRKLIDIPSVLQANVALYYQKNNTEEQPLNKDHIDLQRAASEIQLPDNSISTLFILIKQSRICYKFVRQYIKLLVTSCIISTLIFLLSLVFFKQDFGIKLIHVLWTQGFILISLSIALAFDTETEHNQNFSIMNEHSKKYNNQINLIDKQGWKQILIYSLTEIIILLIVIFLGPIFIPQKPDQIDLIFKQDWMAKYADINKNTICSGLPFSLQAADRLYKQTFQKYNIFSRHQTIVFTLFSVMQIFNYFNFRQFNIREVNIFRNCKILSLLIIILIFIANLFFIQNIGSYAGLYPKGLIFQQWVICIALSMIVWVVGIVSRLFPNLRKQDYGNQVKWTNKSYNLAVKAVVSQDNLAQFQVDQYFQLNPDNRKVQ